MFVQPEESTVSNAIRFLESLGSNPRSSADYAGAIAALPVSPRERQALLARDHVGLGLLLGGRDQMKCLVFSQEEIVQ